MSPENRERLIAGAKRIAIAVLAFIAIIANAALWNAYTIDGVSSALGTFPLVVSILNVILEGFGIYKLFRFWVPKEKKESEE